jgi:hypothetical protein
MSSATSTSADRVPREERDGGDAKARGDQGPNTFRASHFFTLASLMAATAAVIMSRRSTPEHLVLVSVTIAAAGLAAAGFYRVLSPLVGEAELRTFEPLSARARAVVEREKLLVLRAIKDLEFDRSMGKVSPADFELMAARLRARALSLMKQIDEDGSGYRSIIERELQARLAAQASDRAVAVVEPVEPVETVETTAALIPGACACGTANDPDAVFCKRCGSKLAEATSASGETR